MARPLWGKEAAFWLTAAIIAVTILALIVWWGDRQLAQQQAKVRIQLAAQAAQLEVDRKAAERVRAQVDEQRTRGEQINQHLHKLKEASVQGQLMLLASGYQLASEKLKHPPKDSAELEPFLKVANGLISSRDGHPFEVAWGTHLTKPGRLLAWEKTPWEDHSRIVLITDASPKRVTAEEFDLLTGLAEPEPVSDNEQK